MSIEDKTTEITPNLLTYPRHVASPKIEITDLSLFTRTSTHKVNRALQKRVEEITKLARELQEDFELNQEVYASKYTFEPIVGECYHLYENTDGSRSLSLISPSEWNKKHLYSIVLNSDYTWTKVIGN